MRFKVKCPDCGYNNDKIYEVILEDGSNMFSMYDKCDGCKTLLTMDINIDLDIDIETDLDKDDE
jgi:uncharacterized Zn finger protein